MKYVGYVVLVVVTLILVLQFRKKRKTKRSDMVQKKTEDREKTVDKNGLETVLGPILKTAGSLWESDLRTVALTGLALLILNPMFKYMTSTVPELWGWYWTTNNHLYFIFFNIGWLAYAYFVSKRDKDKKPLPQAQTKAKVILSAIIVFTIINIGGSMRTLFSQKPLDQPATVASNAPEEVILREIAQCESGGKQFTDNVVTRNMNGTPGDPSDDDIGKWQINLKHQAAIIKELEADVFEEEDNHRVAKEILKRQGTDPWNATRSCWEKGLVARGYNPNKGYLPSSRKEEVASKDGEWSPVVHNDLRFEKVRWHPNQKEGCEIRVDEDDKKIFGCGEMLEGTVPKTFSFRHKQNEPMTVEVRFTDPFR